MGGLVSNLILPIKAAYIRLFEINKYFAVFVLSVSTTVFLFVLMVTLISLGDSGLKEDKSVKLADIVMPEREIDTFMDEVDKPDEPESDLFISKPGSLIKFAVTIKNMSIINTTSNIGVILISLSSS